jgi:hypothetical protein
MRTRLLTRSFGPSSVVGVRVVHLAIVCGVALGGCGTDPASEYISSMQASVDLFCGNCWMSGNWDSERHCRGLESPTRAFTGDLDATAQQCIRDAYAADPDLGPVMSCVARAHATLRGCMASCTNDPEDTTSSDCFNEVYSPAYDACVSGHPMDVLASVTRCD